MTLAQRPKTWSLPLLYLVLASLLLLWPALLNGGPFLFNDTSSYLRGADAGVYKLTGARTEWSGPLFVRHVDHPGKTGARANSREAPVVLSGRSVYYGAILYVSQLLGTFWPAIALQAVLVALSILLTCDILGPPRSNRQRYSLALAIVAGLSLFSPVAYFSSFAMPDIFAALSVLAAGHLALFWDRQERGRRIFWLALLAFALLSHTGNLLLISALFCMAILAGILRIAPVRGAGITAIALALLIGLGGEALFSAAVKSTTGAAPVRPPFLAARLIDDGPGYDYLRRTCPGNGFELCRFLSRLPMKSDQLLWGAGPATGVFSVAPPPVQRALSAEDRRFALAVADDRPLATIISSLQAVQRQVGAMSLVDFNYTDEEKRYFQSKLPPGELARAQESAAFRDKMPVNVVDLATPVIAVASLLLIALVFVVTLRRGLKFGARENFVLLVLAGVLLNDAICGAISTPHDRYQSRIIWLLPLAAWLLIAAYRRNLPIGGASGLTARTVDGVRELKISG